MQTEVVIMHTKVAICNCCIQKLRQLYYINYFIINLFRENHSHYCKNSSSFSYSNCLSSGMEVSTLSVLSPIKQLNTAHINIYYKASNDPWVMKIHMSCKRIFVHFLYVTSKSSDTSDDWPSEFIWSSCKMFSCAKYKLAFNPLDKITMSIFYL